MEKKKYEQPDFELLLLDGSDILTLSAGEMSDESTNTSHGGGGIPSQDWTNGGI